MTYRVAMIGLQGHKNYTLDPMEDMPDTQLVAVATENTRGWENLKEDYPALTRETKVYPNYDEMLAAGKYDIISIYTDHGVRADAIIKSAKNGAAVYTEKPLARTLDELDKVKSVIEQHNTPLTMMLNLRFHGAFIKMRELIQEGAIGEVTQATAQKSYKLGNRPQWMRDKATFAGIIPFIGCHAIDLIRWCGQLEFEQGAAFQSTVGVPDLNDFDNSASLLLLASNGATCSTRLDFCRPMSASSWGDDRLRIAGVDGVVEFIDGRLTLLNKGNKLHQVDYGGGMSQFKNFVASIEKREDVVIPFSDCARITEVCLKLHQAGMRKEVVSL